MSIHSIHDGITDMSTVSESVILHSTCDSPTRSSAIMDQCARLSDDSDDVMLTAAANSTESVTCRPTVNLSLAIHNSSQQENCESTPVCTSGPASPRLQVQSLLACVQQQLSALGLAVDADANSNRELEQRLNERRATMESLELDLDDIQLHSNRLTQLATAHDDNTELLERSLYGQGVRVQQLQSENSRLSSKHTSLQQLVAGLEYKLNGAFESKHHLELRVQQLDMENQRLKQAIERHQMQQHPPVAAAAAGPAPAPAKLPSINSSSNLRKSTSHTPRLNSGDGKYSKRDIDALRATAKKQKQQLVRQQQTIIEQRAVIKEAAEAKREIARLRDALKMYHSKSSRVSSSQPQNSETIEQLLHQTQSLRSQIRRLQSTNQSVRVMPGPGKGLGQGVKSNDVPTASATKDMTYTKRKPQRRHDDGLRGIIEKEIDRLGNQVTML
jgi:archaellum component FlaC